MGDQRFHLIYLDATAGNVNELSRDLKEWLPGERWSVAADGLFDWLGAGDVPVPADRCGPRLLELAEYWDMNPDEDHLTVYDTVGVGRHDPRGSGASPRSLSAMRQNARGRRVAGLRRKLWATALVGTLTLSACAEDGTVDRGEDGETAPGEKPLCEGGLLGIAVHEDFLYAYLTATDANRIERFELTGDAGALSLRESQTVLEGIPAAVTTTGDGSRSDPTGRFTPVSSGRTRGMNSTSSKPAATTAGRRSREWQTTTGSSTRCSSGNPRTRAPAAS